MTGSSPGEICLAEGNHGVVHPKVMMLPDDTLRYNMDLLKPDQFMVLRKKG